MNKKVAEDKSIFEDRKHLLEIWKTWISFRMHSGNIMWKSVQYFFVLISALISANLIGLGMILELDDLQTQFYLLLIFLTFPTLVIALSLVGEAILGRRLSRLLEAIAHTAKIEGLLGLSVDISEHLQKLNIFPKDRYLFERYSKSRVKYNSEEEFIKGELRGGIEGRNMYTDMRKAYFLFIIVGIILILVNIFLIINVHCRLAN